MKRILVLGELAARGFTDVRSTRRSRKSNHDFKLIIAFVENNHTDAILDAARRAGATGSTLINQARGEDVDHSNTFFDLTLETQRDVVLLLV